MKIFSFDLILFIHYIKAKNKNELADNKIKIYILRFILSVVVFKGSNCNYAILFSFLMFSIK